MPDGQALDRVNTLERRVSCDLQKGAPARHHHRLPMLTRGGASLSTCLSRQKRMIALPPPDL